MKCPCFEKAIGKMPKVRDAVASEQARCSAKVDKLEAAVKNIRQDVRHILKLVRRRQKSRSEDDNVAKRRRLRQVDRANTESELAASSSKNKKATARISKQSDGNESLDDAESRDGSSWFRRQAAKLLSESKFPPEHYLADYNCLTLAEEEFERAKYENATKN